MTKLRRADSSGGLGTVLHIEATMTFPNALLLKPDAWRAQPRGDAVRRPDADGRARHRRDDRSVWRDRSVYCQSFRRVVQVDGDDTTSMLFRMKSGASGYLGTITATGPGFSFQVFGSKGWVRLEGMTHVAGASMEERRTRPLRHLRFQPAKGRPRRGRPRSSTSRGPRSKPRRGRAGRRPVPDPDRRDGARRRRDRGGRELGRHSGAECRTHLIRK